jgi:cytochrome c oxidase cbb3-type subunit 3/ubiquinol-cytochrome c reductase cytochrome c subunit
VLARVPPFVTAFALVLATVASGSLECGQPHHTAADLHGAALYGRMCAVCHGARGEGYRADRAPAIAHPDFLASVSDDALRAAITSGRAGTTMSAWGAERGGPLSRSDVDAVVAFMRTWQKREPAVLDERTNAGSAARGEATYARECARCHGARGRGGDYVGIGNPQLLATASNGYLRYAIRLGRSGTGMPAFAATLGDAPIEDTVALLRSWQSPPPPVARPFEPPPRPPPLPLGPVPMNPHGPEPLGFEGWPKSTGIDIIKGQLDRHARMAILDARVPTDYANEHIAGSVSVPFYDPGPYFDKLPRDAWLVCYCACPSAESGMLAKALSENGFKKVTVLAEGLGMWRARKYPTHAGAQP